jgi:hypothetical protein
MARARRWRWSRADAVALEGLSLAVLVLALALGVLAPLVAAVAGSPVTTQVLLDPALVQVGGLPAGVDVDDLTATVTVSAPGRGQAAAVALPTALGGLLVAGGAWLVHGMARSLRRGEPLTYDNARRLVVLALVVGIGGTTVQLAAVAASAAAVGGAEGNGPVVAGGSLSFLPLLAMLPLAALAEVFRRGARALEDVEGLV